jgi:UDP-N-acetylmuramoylalanine--D-glutamate ligase
VTSISRSKTWPANAPPAATAWCSFGESGPKLEAGIAPELDAARVPHTRVATMVEAIPEARRFTQPGDAVLLSPACTSFDAYDNFERRGEEFGRLVRELAVEVPS